MKDNAIVEGWLLEKGFLKSPDSIYGQDYSIELASGNITLDVVLGIGITTVVDMYFYNDGNKSLIKSWVLTNRHELLHIINVLL
jgi:hypothetical protein